MNENLVDEEGFPRNDIDVREVRMARAQINCFQNDLKDLMKAIEQGLAEIHASEGAHLPNMKPPSPKPNENEGESSLNPIVIVNLVSPGSPAESAGIQVRDKIISFGTINSHNFQNLAQIGNLVKNCQNKNMPVRILRDERKLDLTLTPKIWSGQGLLGCNIVPL